MATVVIVLSSGSSWTVPADFNKYNNTVEAIGGGAGGGGGGAGISGVVGSRGGGGGGGGEYRILTNFDPAGSPTIPYSIGGGGGGGSGTAGSVGGDTTFNTVSLVAKGGSGGGAGAPSAGGASGAGGTGGSGGTGRNGGDGGSSPNGSTISGAGGGGGGGAGGTAANGGTGANGVGSSPSGAGGTGGSVDGGSAGTANGGTGGNGSHWTDTNTSAVAGAGGGGGGGNGAPNNSTNPTIPGGPGGNYGGGGGGGGGAHRSGGSATGGGAGIQGVIVITYVPSVISTLTASPGGFSFSGDPIDLIIRRVLEAAPGDFFLDGFSSGLLISRDLVASPGAFVVAGEDVDMSIQKTLTASPGSFVLSGNLSTATIRRVLTASPGAFSLFGVLISLSVRRKVSSFARRVWVERRSSGHENVVYWSAPEVAPTGLLGYNVYRSPQPTTDMTSPTLEKLTPTPVGIPFFIDPQPMVEPLGVPAYLVTEVTSDGEYPIDRSVQVGDESDSDRYGRRSKVLSMPRIYKEFRRRKELLLGFNAETVTFLIRRLVGTRCRQCFDGAYEGSAKASCPECFGTGWDRGYEPVFGAKCRILSIAEALKLNPDGLEFASNPKGWSVGFPLLRQGDVVVRKDGKRYEVQKISLTMHQGVLTGQDYDLIAYDPFHPIYDFRV